MATQGNSSAARRLARQPDAGAPGGRSRERQRRTLELTDLLASRRGTRAAGWPLQPSRHGGTRCKPEASDHSPLEGRRGSARANAANPAATLASRCDATKARDPRVELRVPILTRTKCSRYAGSVSVQKIQKSEIATESGYPRMSRRSPISRANPTSMVLSPEVAVESASTSALLP